MEHIEDLRLQRAIAQADAAAGLEVGPRHLDYVMADTLPEGDSRFEDELIEETLGTGAMCVLYGDSNSGKTFAAIALGAAVAQGTEWLGRRAVKGLVVYLASESPGSVETRLRAYQRYRDVRVPGFAIVRSPVNLFEGQADVSAIIALINELEAAHGQQVALIIGDTLARLAVGANENSGEDMGVVVRNVDSIRSATGAAFVLIHHSGKDAAKGARGWSGLRAATDTEIEVTADEATGLRAAEITKQRDLPGKGARLGFKLESVTLGKNRWGADRGSCVAVPADAPARKEPARRKSEIAGAVLEALTSRGNGMDKKTIAKQLEDRYTKSATYREIKKMVEQGRLVEDETFVFLPKCDEVPNGAN
jgi:RecA-family ATPase